jgi:hypothetical protein
MTTDQLPFYFIFNSLFAKYFQLDGLVLWPFVFIATSIDKTPRHIIKHELTHVDQVRRDGPLRFYFKYVASVIQEYTRNGGDLEKAYFDNEYEKEAYSNENKPLTKSQKNELAKYY